MRAWRLSAYDGPGALSLEEVPEPEAAPGSAVVEIGAIGLNFPDLLTTKGLYQLRPELPFIPGCEIAGVVSAAPPGAAFSPGDRVAALVAEGGFAERAVVPLGRLVALPEAMGLNEAAAMLINYHTVHFALVRRGRLLVGETVLVLGGAGGIGTAAIQVARALGARVIAGVSNGSRAATATAAGAHEVLVLGEGFSVEVRELAGGRGVDLVLDPVGDWLFLEATRCLAPEGRILVVGFAAGEIPTVRVNRLLLNNLSVVGVGWGASLGYDETILTTGAAALDALYAEGSIRPPITQRFAFGSLPDALLALDRREVAGKGVIEGLAAGAVGGGR